MIIIMIMIIKIITIAIGHINNIHIPRAVFFSLAFGLAELFEKAMERGRERENLNPQISNYRFTMV